MASFSNDVKAEICRAITDNDKKYACLYGIMLYSRHISENSISIHTESQCFFQLMQLLLKDVFGNSVLSEFYYSEKKNGSMTYYVNINDSSSIKKIFGTYDINPKKREMNMKNVVNNSLSAFLSGVFFVCGSVTDPNKEYHLEFTVPKETLCEELDNILMSFGISAGRTERKNSIIMYIKDSENIEDILTFMGAKQCTIDLMNIKIYKDVRNKANRIANCDNANINKVVNTSSKQIIDINTVKANEIYEMLSKQLRETAELRLEHPEWSMQEIGDNLSDPIGRSGVKRRFEKIAEMAEKIRQE